MHLKRVAVGPPAAASAALLLLLCLLPLLLAQTFPPTNRSVPDEQFLLRKMFQNYENSVRPVINASRSVAVTFQMILIQIMDMDEKNQVLVTNVWLEHAWIDERLTWNPDDFNSVRVIRVPPKKVWVPDIVLYNNADDFTASYMPINVVINHPGTMYWSPPARLKSSCKVDITFFPFDRQTCHLKFGSWTYDQAQVDILEKSDRVEMTNYVTNGEWELLETSVVRNEIVYPIGNEVYPDVTVVLKIQRRILYYLLNILCPCVWLNILSLLAFILPPSSGEKVTLGITVLLSYSVFMLLVANNMPSTSEFVPLIGIYLTVSMAVTSISVILTVCVLKLHHGGPTQRPAPQWLKTLILVHLNSLVQFKCCTRACVGWRRRRRGCLRWRTASSTVFSQATLQRNAAPIPLHTVRCHNHATPNCVPKTQSLSQSPPRRARPTALPARLVATQPAVAEGASDSPHSFYDNRDATLTWDQLSAASGHYDICTAAPAGSERVAAEKAARDAAEPSQLSSEFNNKILHYLETIVNKRDDDEHEQTVATEWRQIARVIDRFLFYVFFVCTFVCTGTLVVLIPFIHYN